MAITRKRIVYGSVLALAAGAFLWDRAASGPPAPTAAIAAAEPHARGKATPPTPTIAAVAARTGLSQRLQELAQAHHLDAGAVENAFGLSPLWPRKDDATNAATKPSDESVLADAFVKRHKLDAVMVRTRGGYAMLDGKGIVVGQSIDKFRLIAVTKTTATFAHGETRVELRLAPDSKLVQDGLTIEDRAPEPRDIIEPAGK